MAKHIHIHIHKPTKDAGAWEESKHKRAENGQFGSGGSGGTKAPAESGSAKPGHGGKGLKTHMGSFGSKKAPDPKAGHGGKGFPATFANPNPTKPTTAASPAAAPSGKPNPKHPHIIGDPAPKAPMIKGPVQHGQQVEIKPEHQDDGDDVIKWIAQGNEEKGRVTLVASNSTMRIKPTVVVRRDMLANVSDK